jgi:hypothetical protein
MVSFSLGNGPLYPETKLTHTHLINVTRDWGRYNTVGSNVVSVCHLVGGISSKKVNKARATIYLKKRGHYVAWTLRNCWGELKMLSTRVVRKRS